MLLGVAARERTLSLACPPGVADCDIVHTRTHPFPSWCIPWFFVCAGCRSPSGGYFKSTQSHENTLDFGGFRDVIIAIAGHMYPHVSGASGHAKTSTQPTQSGVNRMLTSYLEPLADREGRRMVRIISKRQTDREHRYGLEGAHEQVCQSVPTVSLQIDSDSTLTRFLLCADARVRCWFAERAAAQPRCDAATVQPLLQHRPRHEATRFHG